MNDENKITFVDNDQFEPDYIINNDDGSPSTTNGNTKMITTRSSSAQVISESNFFYKHITINKLKSKMHHFYSSEGLLVEVVLAITAAYIYPQLGADYFYPNITAHWVAVIIIFFCSGLSLKTQELSKAASNSKFNSFVMIYNFLGISIVVNLVAKFFNQNDLISDDLMKGMIICSCLSSPTNMMVVLVVSCNGNETAALFLATIMNLLGVFITPFLIYVYMGESADIDFLRTYKSVGLRVLLPVGVGLMCRMYAPGANAFASENKAFFQKIRERALVFIVYATFCTTFSTPNDSSIEQIFIMAISQVILLIAAMSLAWVLLFSLFNGEPKLRVVGLFGCSTKTAALGLPLISAIYEDHPKLGIYTLPLLIWYPSQLIIGTLLSSRLRRFVEYKIQKYGLEEEDDDDSFVMISEENA